MVWKSGQPARAQTATNSLAVITVTATSTNASEVGPVPGMFTIKRSGAANSAFNVYYKLGGTAINGWDYKQLPGYVSFGTGVVSQTITVTPIARISPSVGDTVLLQLLAVGSSQRPGAYSLGSPSNAVISIAQAPRTNHPPLVQMVRPDNDGSTNDLFVAGANITLSAKASDVDGTVTNVTFFSGTNMLGTAPKASSLFSLAWTNVPAGEYVLSAKATDNEGAATTSDAVKITVVALAQVPVVTVAAKDASASEVGPDPGQFLVTRSSGTNSDLLVRFSLSGTAGNGIDYTKLPQSVLISVGSTSAVVNVLPLADNDRRGESNETVVLQLVPRLRTIAGTSSNGLYVLGTPSNAVVTIADAPHTNVPPAIALAQPLNGAQFLEKSTLTLTAKTSDSDGSVTNVEFFAGTNSLGSRVPPVISGRTSEQVSLSWSNAPSGEFTLTARATDNQGANTTSTAVKIKVLAAADIAVVTVVASDPSASEIGLDPGVFTIKRGASTNGVLTVYYRLSGTARQGSDYQTLSGSVTITNGANSAGVVVKPIADNEKGTPTNETVVLNLVAPLAYPMHGPVGGYYTVGSPSNAVVTIAGAPHTNVPPTVTILRPEKKLVFTPPAEITLAAKATDSDGTIQRIEFFSGTNILGKSIIVASNSRPREVFTLHWTNVLAGDYVVTAIATDDLGAVGVSSALHITVRTNTPTVTSNALPVVTILARDPVASESGNAGTTNVASFLVRRSSGTNVDLTVPYAISGTASNGVDYAKLSGLVTIPAGAISARIVIVPMDDKDDADHWLETVTLTLHSHVASTNTVAAYTVGRQDKASIVIIDRNSVPPGSLHLKDGSFHVRADADLGAWFQVQVSTDLKHWETVCENLVTEGAAHFVDADAPGKGFRFYRIVPMPAPLAEDKD